MSPLAEGSLFPVLPEGPAGGLPISSVSLMLGIPVPTIRSWERRYGLTVSSRTPGRHRRYDIRDIEQLKQMRDAITAGRQAHEAAREIAAGTRRAQGRHDHIRAVLDGAMSFDSDTVRESLQYAVADLGVEKTIQGVVLPVLREIGSRWEAGRCDVANEHLASQEVRSWLGAQTGSRPRNPHPPIVLACGPRDLHTIGLEAFSVLLNRRGWRCRILGARTPTDSLLATARSCGGRAVVVSSHMNINRRATVESIRAVTELPGMTCFYAGNAFSSPAARAGVPGVHLGDDLLAAAEVVERTLVRKALPIRS
jgi:methanogenic corrinoid protein MtbC1